VRKRPPYDDPLDVPMWVVGSLPPEGRALYDIELFASLAFRLIKWTARLIVRMVQIAIRPP